MGRKERREEGLRIRLNPRWVLEGMFWELRNVCVGRSFGDFDAKVREEVAAIFSVPLLPEFRIMWTSSVTKTKSRTRKQKTMANSWSDPAEADILVLIM